MQGSPTIDTMVPVTVLTGFLGSGKTTLLKRILTEHHGQRIAVIENEFGEVSVDDQLIGDRATQIKTLTNGCICCTRSNELEDALLDLLDSRDRGDIDFDRLVIECTGMADPGPIIQTFFSHDVLCQRYLLDGVIALVDAVHADEQMNQFTIAQSQVGYADRIQVQQVAINLLTNAIDAMASTPTQTPTRHLRVVCANHDDQLVVTVSDTGPGIPPDMLAHLFTPFYTTKVGSEQPESAGMGVGLSISRTLIEANGGQLWAQSAPAGGARFQFSVPIARSKP